MTKAQLIEENRVLRESIDRNNYFNQGATLIQNEELDRLKDIELKYKARINIETHLYEDLSRLNKVITDDCLVIIKTLSEKL